MLSRRKPRDERASGRRTSRTGPKLSGPKRVPRPAPDSPSCGSASRRQDTAAHRDALRIQADRVRFARPAATADRTATGRRVPFRGHDADLFSLEIFARNSMTKIQIERPRRATTPPPSNCVPHSTKRVERIDPCAWTPITA